MTDIRATRDPHDGHGRTFDRRERDIRILGMLVAGSIIAVPFCSACIGAYYLLEKLFGTS